MQSPLTYEQIYQRWQTHCLPSPLGFTPNLYRWSIIRRARSLQISRYRVRFSTKAYTMRSTFAVSGQSRIRALPAKSQVTESLGSRHGETTKYNNPNLACEIYSGIGPLLQTIFHPYPASMNPQPTSQSTYESEFSTLKVHCWTSV
jgi:hypothetical protein